MPVHKINVDTLSDAERYLMPTYGSHVLKDPIPKYTMPDSELHPRVAYDIIHDELMLDGNARLNLATFVTTWMEPEARQIMSETFAKNMIDKDEYPQTAEIEKRCVNMLARLWNSPDTEQATGCSTIGSSEACMLAGMALKWKWRAGRKAAGKPADKPNLVMGINVQVCWEKFCRYWEIEPRFVPMEGSRYHLDPEEAAALCDENTIGVVAIMGSTFDGSYEPVAQLNTVLDTLQNKTGLDIPIHVDAASGGLFAPFVQPEIVWDFRVPRVRSINVSGHKYGMVYPGVGWVIWREHDDLPKELIFNVNYLGGQMPTFALSFSRPGAQICAQYYNFLRLGKDGFCRIHQNLSEIAQYLARKIASLGPFQLITDGSDLPVFTFALNDDVTGFSVFDISDRLRERGWQVPAYTFPANREDLAVLRVVLRHGFSRDMADMLLSDLQRHIHWFATQPGYKKKETGTHFSH
jgi:glutamate decarboxylase